MYRYDGFYGIITMPTYVRNKQLYQKLQENLKTCEITYHDIDLSQENIILPNKYIDRLNVINNCQDALNKDGIIITYRLNHCSDNFLRKYGVEDTIGSALILPNKKHIKTLGPKSNK